MMPVADAHCTVREDGFIAVPDRFIADCRKSGIRRQITDKNRTVVKNQRNAVLAVSGGMQDFSRNTESSKKCTTLAAAQDFCSFFVNGLVETVLFLGKNAVRK